LVDCKRKRVLKVGVQLLVLVRRSREIIIRLASKTG